MFGHVAFGANGDAASKAFSMNALAPIGMRMLAENAQGIEMSAAGKRSRCLLRSTEKPAHLHVAFVATERAQVDAFHRAALAAGARDRGAPGLRLHYSGRHYAAFVIGPDGHDIDVVCHEAED